MFLLDKDWDFSSSGVFSGLKIDPDTLVKKLDLDSRSVISSRTGLLWAKTLGTVFAVAFSGCPRNLRELQCKHCFLWRLLEQVCFCLGFCMDVLSDPWVGDLASGYLWDVLVQPKTARAESTAEPRLWPDLWASSLAAFTSPAAAIGNPVFCQQVLIVYQQCFAHSRLTAASLLLSFAIVGSMARGFLGRRILTHQKVKSESGKKEYTIEPFDFQFHNKEMLPLTAHCETELCIWKQFSLLNVCKVSKNFSETWIPNLHKLYVNV